MGKELLIMRHAKSSWGNETLSDHDRPLNKRGLRDAPRMAQLLVEWELVPEIMLCSTAKRARMTAQLLVEIFGNVSVQLDTFDQLYLAQPEAYLELLQQLPDSCGRVMVIGHNPGLEELVAELTGEDEFMATAAIAHVDLGQDTWAPLPKPGSCKLIAVHRPKEVLTD